VRICYYITGHGFGHCVRTAVISNHFTASVELVFKTAAPLSFFQHEVHRPFEYISFEADCGCVQSDGVTVDIEATARKYCEIKKRNDSRRSSEIAWLKSNGIDAVVSDITPFAFEVARGAGIPAIAVTNFTWYDIYEEYAPTHTVFKEILSHMKQQYAGADLLIEAYPALPMAYFSRRKRVGVVGRVGKNRREEICSFYGIAPHKNLGLIYTGNFGMDRIPWKHLEKYANWEFLGLYPLPDSPLNYTLIDSSHFGYENVVASVNCVISKIGYGTFAECVLNGVPLIYIPRTHFSEHPRLEQAVHEWGHGYRIEPERFYQVEFEQSFDKIRNTNKPSPVSPHGATDAAALIEEFVARRT